MLKYLILSTLSFLFLLQLNAQEPRKYTTHIVKQGETLKSISKIYDCKVKELKNLNPDVHDDDIPINTTLVVPNNQNNNNTVTKPEEDKTKKVVIHTVVEGNTLYGIAKEYNVTMQSILDVNNLKNKDLPIGMNLRIPSMEEFTVKPTDKKVVFYLVQKGDTKWRIATLFHITVEKLEALNPGLAHEELKENASIWVPASQEVDDLVKETYLQERDSSYIYHVVKQGEGLFRIAVIYETTEEEISKLNPQAVLKLRPGMLLKIPAKKKDRVLMHTVQKGDTFYSLSKLYNTTETELIELNPLLINGLKEGTSIIIKSLEPNLVSLIKENMTTSDSLGVAKPLLEPNSYYNTPFHISFMMPLMEDQKVDFSQKNSASHLRKIVLDFYSGAKLAIEQLQAQGMPVTYHIYDTKNNAEVVKELVKKPEIINSQAIVGPFFLENAEIVAATFQEKPIIYPIYSSKQDANTQKNLVKTHENPAHQKDFLTNYLLKNYNGQKIVLVSDYQDDNKNFQKNLEAKLKDAQISYQVILPSSNSKNPNAIYINKDVMQKSVLKDKETWVVLISKQNIVVSDVISTYGIASRHHTIKLFTTETFKDYDYIDINYLADLQWAFPVKNFELTLDQKTQDFKKNYQLLYHTNPSEYVYAGFDLTYDTLLRLATNNYFESLEEKAYRGISYQFDYQKTSFQNFKNQSLYMVQMNKEMDFVRLN